MVAFWGVIATAVVLLLVYLVIPKKTTPGRATGFGRDTALRSPDARQPLPDFRVKLYNGEKALTRADLLGKVVVLHIWATWCPPCRGEFPEFASFAKEAGEGVEIIALSLDASPADISTFASGNRTMPPVYLDPQGTLPVELSTTGIPETILVDSKGRIAFRAAGVQDWGTGGIPRLVQQLLKETG
jgi:thiol-disulfide isomerase/thioredoxin